MDDIAIRVQNLTKIYKLYDKPTDRLKESLNPFKKSYHKDFYALNNVSFEIKKGDTVGIIGKNGAGKSTLLKIITGVLTQNHGKVETVGKIASLLELGAGFNPEYTGIENIYLQGSLMGYTKEEIEKKLDNILSFADIGEYINQSVKTYSSGMFARLAFAIAINVEPDILIIDEALSVGDLAFQSKCFNKFKEFQKKNKTILFVTHSIDLIIKYCQFAILINEGQIILQDDTKTTTEMFRKIMVGINEITSEIKVKDIYRKPKGFLYKESLPLNSKANIYGSLDGEIVDFGIINSKGEITNYLKNNEEYCVIITARFYKDVMDPILAYTFKSADGAELTGTNTNNLDIVFGKVSAGETITVKFSQKMILNSGSYLLALGCTKYQNDGLKVFHRIYDAVHVDVVSNQLATGIAYYPTDIEIKREFENGTV